jgi:hypothetical protein
MIIRAITLRRNDGIQTIEVGIVVVFPSLGGVMLDEIVITTLDRKKYFKLIGDGGRAWHFIPYIWETTEITYARDNTNKDKTKGS